MSKALEAAHEAGVEAFKTRFSADCSAVDALTDYRDALLAHLAEDEEVVRVAMESIGPSVNEADIRCMFRDIARTLSGKE